MPTSSSGPGASRRVRRGAAPTPVPEPLDGGTAIVVGAGLAGLFTALTIARGRHDRRQCQGQGQGQGQHGGPAVTLIARDRPGRGASSAWAQGGIAAAVGADDAPEAHAADTVTAGAGLVDEDIARLVAQDMPKRIEDLIALGVPFDQDSEGRLVLGREGAHSRQRIVRVSGDRAGAAVTAALGRAVEETPSIRILTGLDVDRLVVQDGRVQGLLARPTAPMGHHGHAAPVMIRAPHVVLATGGAGALYDVTTTPLGLLGSGLGMAAIAGARIRDPEFVQFHPTAMVLGRDPAPLATEALRGEGAVLVTASGQRIMHGVHADMELAPRDVVARAIHARLGSGESVYLDCREAIGTHFPDAFPTVYALCQEAGLDPVQELIPVAPAAHYHMGGIATDTEGRSSLAGLWACGEVAGTGLHGANRLASNSLAEALVFGGRIGTAIRGESQAAKQAMSASPALEPPTDHSDYRPAVTPATTRLRQVMTRDVGLIRTPEGLTRAAQVLLSMRDGTGAPAPALATASLIVAGALQRRESRGSHFRSDCPQSNPAWARSTVMTLAEATDILHAAARRAEPGQGRPARHEAHGLQSIGGST